MRDTPELCGELPLLPLADSQCQWPSRTAVLRASRNKSCITWMTTYMKSFTSRKNLQKKRPMLIAKNCVFFSGHEAIIQLGFWMQPQSDYNEHPCTIMQRCFAPQWKYINLHQLILQFKQWPPLFFRLFSYSPILGEGPRWEHEHKGP